MRNMFDSKSQDWSIALLMGGDKENLGEPGSKSLDGLDKLLHEWERMLDLTVENDLNKIEKRINEDLK